MNTKIILSFLIGCTLTFFVLFFIQKNNLFSTPSESQNISPIVESEVEEVDEIVKETQTGEIIIEEEKKPSIYKDEKFCTVKDIHTLSNDEYNAFLLSLKNIKRDTNFSNAVFGILKKPQDCDFLINDKSERFSEDEHQECLVKNTLKMIFTVKGISKDEFPPNILEKVPLLSEVYQNVQQKNCNALKEIKEEFVQYCTGEKDYIEEIQKKYQGVKTELCE